MKAAFESDLKSETFSISKSYFRLADKEVSLILSGTGDVLEPKDGLMAIGSGGNFALAAARAMFDSKLKPEEIAKKSLEIAAELCIYTNNNIIVEKIK